MIQNIVFDFGNVLVRFDRYLLSAPYTETKADCRAVAEAVFETPEWFLLDLDAISDEALLQAAYARLPERLHKSAQLSYENWMAHLPDTPGMPELISRLKAEKKGLYLLSNIISRFRTKANLYPVLRQFDGLVLSGEEGLIKPDPHLFSRLFSRYGLVPEECFFIDDAERNVLGARACGMEGFVFTGSVPRLTEALFEKGILPRP